MLTTGERPELSRSLTWRAGDQALVSSSGASQDVLAGRGDLTPKYGMRKSQATA